MIKTYSEGTNSTASSTLGSRSVKLPVTTHNDDTIMRVKETKQEHVIEIKEGSYTVVLPETIKFLPFWRNMNQNCEKKTYFGMLRHKTSS